MTDTIQQAEHEEEDEGDLLPDLFVERSTSLLYEVRFFDNFVIVRPATPSFYLAIRKMNHLDFANEFEEFSGDKELIREFLRGQTPDFIVEN